MWCAICWTVNFDSQHLHFRYGWTVHFTDDLFFSLLIWLTFLLFCYIFFENSASFSEVINISYNVFTLILFLVCGNILILMSDCHFYIWGWDWSGLLILGFVTFFNQVFLALMVICNYIFLSCYLWRRKNKRTEIWHF